MDNAIKIPHMETITNTAIVYNLPVHFIRAAVANGDIVAVRAGRKFLVNCDSLEMFLRTGIPQGTAMKAAPRRSDEEAAPRISPISLR
ncbi:MAG: hypothetical protein NC299_10675 [Lachnospiraceae bacterium]|nr:hypothetical protein [Ruminococcus sp.]MCM1275812.1 hypothetical protein [Lachnospiraceae bacterium]